MSAETGLAGVLVILLIFAFAIPAGFGAWLASTKGRSAIAWFFLCGIFSWIAVLALGLSPSGQSTGRLFDPPRFVQNAARTFNRRRRFADSAVMSSALMTSWRVVAKPAN